MGTESKVDLNDCALYLGDKPIARGEIELAEITVPADMPKPECMLTLQQMEFKTNFKELKRWRCKGRRRFIKLLMSKGISRNEAGSVARAARIAGVPYGELWRDYFFWG